ncbi:hypothetical protein [Cohnella sp. GCM10027633]|uniref:hypothetical protein n=1 Tax=unclassified Cohnella TaxID=2636738 RepID=UPI00363730E6
MNDADPWNRDDNERRMPSGYPPPYGRSGKRRSKWIAGLLAFLVPGTGHMYLGLMFKAVSIMLLLAANIAAIVQMSKYDDNALTIVLLSLLMPIIYFYNLFDAIQSAETVNDRLAAAEWNAHAAASERRPDAPAFRTLSYNKLVVLVVVGIIVFLLAQETWSDWVFDSTLSIVGAVLLIAGGIALWIWELRNPQQPKP